MGNKDNNTNKTSSSKHYLTGREIRAIAKANSKEMKRLEAYKNRKASEEEFISELNNPENILEIDDLHNTVYFGIPIYNKITAELLTELERDRLEELQDELIRFFNSYVIVDGENGLIPEVHAFVVCD